MPLQVRLIHSLGQQVVELPERLMDKPLVVGRSAEAEVQVPAANVSRRHCLFFVHEGRWVLQDGGSSAGTLVNGQAVSESVYLNSGDVVSLGGEENAAQIVIDPFGQGVIATATLPSAAPAAPRPKPYRAASPTAMNGPLPQPGAFGGAVPSPGVMPEYSANYSANYAAAPQPSLFDGQPTSDEAEFDAAQFRTNRVVRRPPGLSPGMWVLGAVLALLIGGIGLRVLYIRAHNSENYVIVIGQKPTTEEVVKLPGHVDSGSAPVGAPIHGSKLFADPGLYGSQNAGPQNNAPFKVAASRWSNAATAPAMQDAANSAGNVDPDYERVYNAHSDNIGNPHLQIAIYADYLQTHAQSAYIADVQGFINEALDRIWWIKIDKYLLDRQSLEDSLKRLKEDIESEKPELRKPLVDQQTAAQGRLAAVQAHLTEMNYLSKERPVMDDPAQMALLRQARDTNFFDRWKEQERKKIINSHGQEW
jgi:hypothetical protein